MATPTLALKTHNSITITAPAAPSTGQSIEYGINNANSAPSTWQDSTTFTGLNADTAYYIFARAKENSNYLAGAPSSALTVTTDTAPGGGEDLPASAEVYLRDGDGTMSFSSPGIYNNIGGSSYNELVIVFDKEFSGLDVVIDLVSATSSLNFELRHTAIGVKQDRSINWNAGNEYGRIAEKWGQESWPVTINSSIINVNAVVINCGGVYIEITDITIKVNGVIIPLIQEGKLFSEYRWDGPLPPAPVWSLEAWLAEGNEWDDAGSILEKTGTTPEYTVINGEITVTNRTNNWDGIKIHFTDTSIFTKSLENYSLIVNGRTDRDRLVLGQPDAPYSEITESVGTGEREFTLHIYFISSIGQLGVFVQGGGYDMNGGYITITSIEIWEVDED